MTEIWKDIAGYEGIYQVSNTGKIKSFQRWKRAKSPDEYLLKQYVANNGYCQVTLYRDGGKRKFLVHRLVAEAFIPNPNGYGYINHMDENKENNRADNLEWCTIQYNNAYGTARLRKMLTIGYPVEQRLSTGQLLATYVSVAVASEITGASHKDICACIRGQLNSAGGFAWTKPVG